MHHIKDTNEAPWQKPACFGILRTAAFYVLELNGLDNVLAFVSYELGIDMSLVFQ